MSTKIDALFGDYSTHHRTAGNQRCHLIGIPMIAFGLFGLLSVEVFRAGAWPVEVAPLLMLALLPVQLRLEPRLGALLTVLYVFFYLGARMLPWQVNAGLFVVGWIFQFIGHYHYENKSPSFFTNLIHLFTGPLWVLNHVLGLRPTASAQRPATGGS